MAAQPPDPRAKTFGDLTFAQAGRLSDMHRTRVTLEDGRLMPVTHLGMYKGSLQVSGVSFSVETALGADRQRMNPQSDTKNALKRVDRVRNLFQQVWRYQASISIDAGLVEFPPKCIHSLQANLLLFLGDLWQNMGICTGGHGHGIAYPSAILRLVADVLDCASQGSQ